MYYENGAVYIYVKIWKQLGYLTQTDSNPIFLENKL